ncbi:hypothetical protein KRP22_008383 [Phytophthora ramorum]|uniref:uncharacterized protein n=1 Tax=Phytophthora ramorum TaxID=164328 RepID=UPI0030AD6161|nr:hypothetical protein KRP23_14798 [Phytophthora ramorum]KAH7505631.1 hypothetical protein KRP22_3604 [Phytophthora ramorum]
MEDQSCGSAAAPCAASSASQPVAIETKSEDASVAADPRLSDLSRLFIVCGRGRKVDELRALFSTCGAIKHLHLALDRSKKSRGFAFLQYEDPANAAVAIDKLDHLELDDGHILKVTVAKERPVGGKGKLKRDQHARQDQDDKSDGGLGDEDDGVIDARLPGKRQRSSPPVTALPLGPSRVSPAFLLEAPRLEGFGADSVKIKTEMQSGNGLPAVDACKDELMEPDGDEKQVQHVLDAMVAVVEQQQSQSKLSSDLIAAYQHVVSTSDQGGKQNRGKNLRVVIPGVPEEENSTDSLASSIRSVSLASTPMTTRCSRLDLLRTPREASRDVETIPPRPKHHLRRRRQSLDGSGSSTEDGSDSRGIRRKRSNTTTSPPPTLKAQIRQPLSPPRKKSERSDISLSPEALKAEIIAKKVCKRQSSDNTIEESYRLAKQQATRERRDHGGSMVDRGPVRPTITDVDNSYGKDRDIKLEFRTEPPEPVRTKVFFTSTYKFTEQELEAMFAVYGDFESVELVKSFGRVKTMAYVRYSKPSTAAFVVKSFREESSQGNECPEKPEFMTLSFAHETTDFQLQQRARLAHFPERALNCSSDLYPSLSGGSTSAPSTGTVMPSSGKDRLWVLLLYDRFLATHMLSSVVSSLSGMEFMDIKVVKSTGEAQGVAFVKFDSEANATQGALQLHQMELPLGSGKFLQAIVILAPSLFTTTHGGNSISNNESMRLDRSADERVVTGSSDDVDLRAVEARFAHLMRSSEHQHSREGSCFPQYSSPRGAAPSDLGHQPPMAAGVYPPSPSAGFHTSMSLSGGMEYYPMQLVTFPPPPPQQPFQPYANFAGPASYQQLPQHPSFVPGWMETSPYYQGGVPQQYPFSCTPEQEMAFPVTNHSSNVADNIDAYAVPPKPRSSRSPSEQMDIEDGNSSCSSQASSSIHVSSSGPLELVTLVTALQDCPGVVSFAKNAAAGSELTGYMVDFSNETQAFEAVRKLDGALCGDQKLRVAKSTSMRHRGGGKSRSGSGRRKRQRVDPRCRK